MDLRGYALIGAKAELERILEAFPELRNGEATKGAEDAPTPTAEVRARRPMSMAQKRKVSARMRAYWAARRAGASKGAARKGAKTV